MKRAVRFIVIIWLLVTVVILLYLPLTMAKADRSSVKQNHEHFLDYYLGCVEELVAAVWFPDADAGDAEKTPHDAEIQFKLIDAPLLCQNPDYPTGCEAFAAVMDLQYYGFNITPEKFIKKYLPLGTRPHEVNGVWYGADPNESFLGSPDSESGMGIWASGLASAIKKVPRIRKFSVFCTYGETLESLCEKYVSRDIPVIVWVTQNMQTPYAALVVTVENSGKAYTWMSPNHCMLLVGFDEGNYYFNDPITGRLSRYGKNISDAAFIGNGSQAVVISRK